MPKYLVSKPPAAVKSQLQASTEAEIKFVYRMAVELGRAIKSLKFLDVPQNVIDAAQAKAKQVESYMWVTAAELNSYGAIHLIQRSLGQAITSASSLADDAQLRGTHAGAEAAAKAGRLKDRMIRLQNAIKNEERRMNEFSQGKETPGTLSSGPIKGGLGDLGEDAFNNAHAALRYVDNELNSLAASKYKGQNFDKRYRSTITREINAAKYTAIIALRLVRGGQSERVNGDAASYNLRTNIASVEASLNSALGLLQPEDKPKVQALISRLADARRKVRMVQKQDRPIGVLSTTRLKKTIRTKIRKIVQDG